MQTALAVNASLLTLTKLQIFCTEPHRVPLAGKVDVCLFDKTGTITTDQLAAAGTMSADSATEKHEKGVGEAAPPLTPLDTASDTVQAVLAGCHSLVVDPANDQLQGDPVELAAIKAAGWVFDSDKSCATPRPRTPFREAGAC